MVVIVPYSAFHSISLKLLSALKNLLFLNQMIHSLKQCVDKTYAMNVMLYWLLPWENVPQEMRNIKWISLIEMNFKSSIILTILFDQQPIASTSKTNCNKNYTNDNNNNKWDDSQWNLFFFIANAILLYSFLFINIYGFC